MKQLILESSAGVCVPLKNLQAHEGAIRDFFTQFEKNQLGQVPEEFSGRFNRRVLTGELARQFESLMDYDKNAFVKLEEEL
jgi:hypothetical protein